MQPSGRRYLSCTWASTTDQARYHARYLTVPAVSRQPQNSRNSTPVCGGGVTLVWCERKKKSANFSLVASFGSTRSLSYVGTPSLTATIIRCRCSRIASWHESGTSWAIFLRGYQPAAESILSLLEVSPDGNSLIMGTYESITIHVHVPYLLAHVVTRQRSLCWVRNYLDSLGLPQKLLASKVSNVDH